MTHILFSRNLTDCGRGAYKEFPCNAIFRLRAFANAQLRSDSIAEKGNERKNARIYKKRHLLN